MSKPIKSSLFVLLNLICILCFSQGQINKDYKSKIDQYLTILEKNKDFSGSLLIAKGDTILYKKTCGFANYELNVPQSAATKIRIASITKTFTAASIVLLINQSKISLSDPLSKFIPTYPQGDKIKVEHLLSHSAGIPPLTNELLFRPDLTDDEIIDYLKSQPLQFEPGTNDAYSNTGYFLLAMIVQSISGKSFEDFLSENIFEKLKMTNSGIYEDSKIISSRANAYSPGPYNGLMNTPWYSMVASTGSGNIYSTVEDLHKWGKAIRKKILFDIYKLEYPYGWGRRTFDGKKYLSQTGYNEGYNALLLVFENGLTISYLNNIGNLLFNKIEKDIPAILYDKPYALPQVKKAVPPPTDVAQYAGVYLNNNTPFFKIFCHGSALYFQFLDSKFKNYLEPIGQDRFIMRNEFSVLSFSKNQSGNMVSVNISFGENDKGSDFKKQ